jgi:hypothetical protein
MNTIPWIFDADKKWTILCNEKFSTFLQLGRKCSFSRKQSEQNLKPQLDWNPQPTVQQTMCHKPSELLG